jgi:CRP-like cAMP-binding protein
MIKNKKFVGESCIFINKPQMFNIKTKELSQLVKIDRTTFFDILEESTNDGSIMIKNHIVVHYF